jgi:hypothetical protein
MKVYSMMLYWKIGETMPPEPGIIAVTGSDLKQAIHDADKNWIKFKVDLDPPPFGYVVYDGPSKTIVHEQNLELPSKSIPPRAISESVESGPSNRRRFWQK